MEFWACAHRDTIDVKVFLKSSSRAGPHFFFTYTPFQIPPFGKGPSVRIGFKTLGVHMLWEAACIKINLHTIKEYLFVLEIFPVRWSPSNNQTGGKSVVLIRLRAFNVPGNRSSGQLALCQRKTTSPPPPLEVMLFYAGLGPWCTVPQPGMVCLPRLM